MSDLLSELNYRFMALPRDTQEALLKLIARVPKPIDGNEWGHLNCPMCGGSGHIDDAKARLVDNVRSQATDAALSRQVACTDGLGVAVPPAPTFGGRK